MMLSRVSVLSPVSGNISTTTTTNLSSIKTLHILDLTQHYILFIKRKNPNTIKLKQLTIPGLNYIGEHLPELRHLCITYTQMQHTQGFRVTTNLPLTHLDVRYSLRGATYMKHVLGTIVTQMPFLKVLLYMCMPTSANPAVPCSPISTLMHVPTQWGPKAAIGLRAGSYPHLPIRPGSLVSLPGAAGGG